MVEPEAVEILPTLFEQEALDRIAFECQQRVFASQSLDRCDRLEPHKTIVVSQRVDQDIYRMLARDARERGRDVPSDPDVLFWIGQEVVEDINDGGTVPDERFTRTTLETAAAEQ